MAGLNNIREAYEKIYTQLDERMSEDEREMRRLAAQERRAGKSDRTDAKTASKYADSEKRSADREDKKSKGKHIHGYAIDSYQPEGDVVDEKKDDSYLETDMEKRRKNNEKAIADMKKTKAHADMVKAARKHFEEFVSEEDPCWKGYTQVGMKKKNGKEVPNCVPSKGVPKAKGYKKEEAVVDEAVYKSRKDIETEKREKSDTRYTVTAADRKANTKAWQNYKAGDKRYKAASHVGEETLKERALDTAEKGEKERLVKGMKKSASDFKKRYGERAKSVMYATATKMAKKHMDTSKSDRRYAVEENEAQHKTRKPSQIAKREKLTKLLDQIREKRKGEKE